MILVHPSLNYHLLMSQQVVMELVSKKSSGCVSVFLQQRAGQSPVCSSLFSHLALSPEFCYNPASSHWSPLSQDFARKEMTNLVSLMLCLNFPIAFTLFFSLTTKCICNGRLCFSGSRVIQDLIWFSRRSGKLWMAALLHFCVSMSALVWWTCVYTVRV